MSKYMPIIKDFPVLIHGGDYNPEQWIDRKDEIWAKDMEYAKKAGINSLSIGIFSWSMLEPNEGEYCFEWLDEVMDMLAANGMKAVLATPSGARPAWLAEKYPEVLRVDADRRRHLFGGRHNHCLTSPVYREKVRQINTRLAERYKDHPALGLWHVSNEYSGECHCPLCQDKFREWLRKRFGTIEKLNAAWWSAFWSHRYNSFEQIESPSPIGECGNPALELAWRRFSSQQICDFYSDEIKPLKAITPSVPCTTNLMHTYDGIDYFALGRLLDCTSWDNYPMWTNDSRDAQVALHASFCHDLMRGTGGNRPFLMMESSPSCVNWQDINRLRRPGILTLQSLQAIAHGSDSVQYFQFRKGRGSTEKYHGAVIGHDGSDKTRVFSEVAEVGKALAELSEIVGSLTDNRVALVYDWENRWALDSAQFGIKNKKYEQTVKEHYEGFVRSGYGVDIIDQLSDLSRYAVVCAPMAYMLRSGFAERVESFVRNGGIYIATYCSGWVDDENLCFDSGYPGELRKVLGIWDEETDALDETQHNSFMWQGKCYTAKDYCAVVHPLEAKPLAVYEENFYSGCPAITVNEFGKGKAYFLAARTGSDFLACFEAFVCREAGLNPIVNNLPYGVLCTERINDNGIFTFVMNTLPDEMHVVLPKSVNMLTGNSVNGETVLQPYGVLVLKKCR